MPGYKRILLKLSGEALAGTATFGIDADRVRTLAREVADVVAGGVQVGVVVGGGNIFRGVAAAATSATSRASDLIRPAWMPKASPPASDSPLSFSRTRLNAAIT